jgi:hypothetical protein
MLQADAPHRIVNVIGEVAHCHGVGLRVLFQEGSDGGDLDDAADIAQRVQLCVVHVARMIAERAHAGMR